MSWSQIRPGPHEFAESATNPHRDGSGPEVSVVTNIVSVSYVSSIPQ